ncbi:hypothetical protein BABINDRAFT_108994 [Babjeviella inositovora NRRL Y-12698]|uniref:Uncharacterized protein n=1 Tax=Babjeviella inositovora NRRL Y-12698 TaxID=984486 RepID=A0A1E3QX43_9ASCO|nr:uncharacterized protein BABINDRAFT_108994 [Babjeviella inositovora NRRL Y-12698]ODQ81577.1 hypothetical protein BABINDRAFT_108994 [Babjeviella inositovora NRRL Y-12698]
MCSGNQCRALAVGCPRKPGVRTPSELIRLHQYSPPSFNSGCTTSTSYKPDNANHGGLATNAFTSTDGVPTETTTRSI